MASPIKVYLVINPAAYLVDHPVLSIYLLPMNDPVDDWGALIVDPILVKESIGNLEPPIKEKLVRGKVCVSTIDSVQDEDLIVDLIDLVI